MIEAGAIAELFGTVFGGIPAAYGDGFLNRKTRVDDGKGGWTVTDGTPLAIKVQRDQCTERMRESPGYTERDVRLMILRNGVSIEDLTSDDEITTPDGRVWHVSDVQSDPASSYWECRGVERLDSEPVDTGGTGGP